MTDFRRQWIAVLLAIVAALLSPPRAMGADDEAGGTTAPAATRPGGADTRPVTPRSSAEDRAVSSDGGRGAAGSIVRTLLALAVVVALIVGLRIALRRFRGSSVSRTGPMSVLARTSVSARQQLLLVRLGRRLVLVGSGPEGMRALTEVLDADEVADLIRQAGGKADGKAGEGQSSREGGS